MSQLPGVPQEWGVQLQSLLGQLQAAAAAMGAAAAASAGSGQAQADNPSEGTPPNAGVAGQQPNAGQLEAAQVWQAHRQLEEQRAINEQLRQQHAQQQQQLVADGGGGSHNGGGAGAAAAEPGNQAPTGGADQGPKPAPGKLAKDNSEATEQQRAVAAAAAAAAAATGAAAAGGGNDAAAISDDLSDFTGGIASEDDLGDEEEQMAVDEVVSKLSGEQKAAVRAILDKRRLRRCRQTRRNKKPEEGASATKPQGKK